MVYRNARDVLPAPLLEEVQKYTGGTLIYIPTPGGSDSKADWGSRSGARREYDERNRRIRKMYGEKISCEELSRRFCLSPDSIRKIVSEH